MPVNFATIEITIVTHSMSKWQELQKRLKIKFKNEKLLIRAFTHSSFFSPEKCQPSKHYERLEFLGDSVLEYVVTNLLFAKCSRSDEGRLTRLRSTIVSRHILVKVFNRLDLSEFVRFKLENLNRFSLQKLTDSIKADVVEALIGAIHQDKGLKACSNFIEKHIFVFLENIRRRDSYFNPINKLQELLARIDKRAKPPHYQIIKKTRTKENDPCFKVHLFFKGKLVSQAQGASKKEAAKEAARKALKKLSVRTEQCSVPTANH